MNARVLVGLVGGWFLAGCGASRVKEPASVPEAAQVPGKPAAAGTVESDVTPAEAAPSVKSKTERGMEEGSRVVSTAELDAALQAFGDGERQLAELLAVEAGGLAPASPPRERSADEAPAAAAREDDLERSAKKDRPAPKATASRYAEPSPAAGPSNGAGRCSTACKALDSMRRAASRMCDLLGDGDAQCSDARGRLARSEARVASVCPSCSGGR
jgi:hypothetical protein